MAHLELIPEAAFLELLLPSDVYLESEEFVSLKASLRLVQILLIDSTDTPISHHFHKPIVDCMQLTQLVMCMFWVWAPSELFKIYGYY